MSDIAIPADIKKVLKDLYKELAIPYGLKYYYGETSDNVDVSSSIVGKSHQTPEGLPYFKYFHKLEKKPVTLKHDTEYLFVKGDDFIYIYHPAIKSWYGVSADTYVGLYDEQFLDIDEHPIDEQTDVNESMNTKFAWVPASIKEGSREAFAQKAIAFKKQGARSFVFEGKTYKIKAEKLDEAKVYKLPTKTAQHLARLDIPGISRRNIEMLLTQVMSGRNVTPQLRPVLRRLLPKLIALAAETPYSVIDKVEASVTLDTAATEAEIASTAKQYGIKYKIIDDVGPVGGAPVVEYSGDEESLRKLIKDRFNNEQDLLDLIEPAN